MVTGNLFREDPEGGIGEGSAFIGMAGVFEIVSGEGIFEGLSGGGVFTAFGVGDDAGDITVMLGGAIVPAPAALALLAI